MTYTPTRRKLEARWGNSAEATTNQKEPGNPEGIFVEYLWNTNGLSIFMLAEEKYNNDYSDWGGVQAGYVAARQNLANVGVMSIKISNERIKKAIRVIRVYDKERADTLDDRLSNIEMRVAKIAPVNMARIIENAPRDCMQRMVEQLTDQVVGKLEKLAEKKEREEIQWGKQGEAIPEDEEMEEVSFEPRVTFSQEENWKVEREHKKMEVEEQDFESARHDPTIPPGENGRRFRALHQVDRF